ncbi:MAG: potassium/proton antiporter [Bacteroidales bacterium]|nr:MAG: potassium/proton antiporter [Paludibacter sp.]MCE1156156.1 potassium/proton antiporter [Bacteroidales bacterium]OJX91600.1 MAG: K+/H+ antiporter [Paludibacter sp. 47-17]
MSLNFDFFILIGSVLLFFSLIAGKTGYKYGVPTLLLFLFIGIIAGSGGLGLQFSSPSITQYIGVIALNIILFSGGMDTRLSEVKPIAREGVVLATVGVLLTALITGLFVYWLTNSVLHSVTFSLLESLLLAGVMSSTDSASVFSILRSKNLSMKENLRPLLELESGSNDPMAYMITIVLIQLLNTPEISGWMVFVQFFQQLVFGAGAGYLLGKFAVRLINRINLDNDALYSVLMLTVMFFIYGLTTQLGGNGYLAVYLGGLIIGNHKIVHRRSTLKFFDGLTWLFQIIMFLALGLLVEPRELLPIAGVGIIVGLFMILVSRPLSVFLSLLPFKNLSFRARVFTSWVGLRGAVPIIFATYPWVNEVPQAKMIFNIVFFITILSLMVQGTTVPLFAKWLNLSKILPSRPKLKEFDVEFSDDIKSATCEITVNQEMLKQGSNLLNINLPEHTLVVMVKRHGRYFIPRGNTHLEEGDSLLVITDNEEAMRETYRQLGISPLE